MPVVPFTKSPAPSQPMPSSATILMALAEMQRQGRFAQPSFEDRAAPIKRDIKSGIADAQGRNYTDFEKK